MILYRLRCGNGDLFEAWFRDGATFDSQAAAGAVTCPACGDTGITKAPMAPSIARGAKAPEDGGAVCRPGGGAPAPDRGAEPPAALSSDQRAAALREALHAFARHVRATCDDVGDRFAEEARRIHCGEAEARGIYGRASRDEVEALDDEGIEIAPLPALPRNDA
ncbi:MAG: DUF1178 family protein [Azospirillaceae bacterium]